MIASYSLIPLHSLSHCIWTKLYSIYNWHSIDLEFYFKHGLFFHRQQTSRQNKLLLLYMLINFILRTQTACHFTSISHIKQNT